MAQTQEQSYSYFAIYLVSTFHFISNAIALFLLYDLDITHQFVLKTVTKFQVIRNIHISPLGLRVKYFFGES